MKHTPITSKAKTKFTFSDNMDISMKADGSGGAFKSPNKQTSRSTSVKDGVEYKKLNTSEMSDFKGGTAPIAGGNMAKFSDKAIKMFTAASKQYAKRQPQNIQSFIKQAKSVFKVKSNRNMMSNKEKVTGLSDDFFKGVEKNFKKQGYKEVSPGYYAKPAPNKNLEEVAEQLEGAVKAHGKQAKAVRKHIAEMEDMKSPAKSSPAKRKDACYHKVKSRYKKWPSAYASGALAKCRKVGASNWGNKS